MTTPTERATTVAAILRRARFRSSSEAALQSSIAEALVAAQIDFEAEKRLAPGERIDFMIAGGVGIEAKARYAKRQTIRQLERYAAIDEVEALILVTGTAMGLPRELNGKPLFHVSIGRSAL